MNSHANSFSHFFFVSWYTDAAAIVCPWTPNFHRSHPRKKKWKYMFSSAQRGWIRWLFDSYTAEAHFHLRRKYSTGNRTTDGRALATYQCTETNKPNASKEKVTAHKQITVNKSHEQKRAKEATKSLLLWHCPCTVCTYSLFIHSFLLKPYVSTNCWGSEI